LPFCFSRARKESKLIAVACALTTGFYSNNFSKVFSGLLEKSSVTCYKICNYAHIDEAYVSRLKSGEKNNPTAEVVLRISLALVHFAPDITIHDIEALLNSTGRSILPKRQVF
jgi:transcriptional regulator with XRE-family HTH domain